jgi:hypothetical protein
MKSIMACHGRKGETMKNGFLTLGLVALCLNASPTKADSFSFTYGALQTWYDTGSGIFTADVVDGLSAGSVTRIEPPTGSAIFDTAWGGPEHFALSMSISNIGGGGMTADGSGSFTLTDVDSDTISGNLIGSWQPQGNTLRFNGDLSNVVYTPSSADETLFNGDSGSASMAFGSPSPWSGAIIELTASGLSFNTGWGDSTPNDGVGGVLGAGATAVVTTIPVPAALLLGTIGIGLVGWMRRLRAL